MTSLDDRSEKGLERRNQMSTAAKVWASAVTPIDVRDSDYNAHRLNVVVPGVREFQAAYEQAVPDVPAQEVLALTEAGAPWSQMLELIERCAPYGASSTSETTSIG
jgi:hypothetical protein